MRPLLQSVIIDEDQNQDLVLNILADPYCRKILHAIQVLPKSAMDIGYATGVPISTVYRRIQDLIDAKMMSISGSISKEGKKFFMYQSSINKISSYFDGRQIHVEVIRNYSHLK